jgi:transcriptional regulator with GAF, ATPase, and Fis domain
VVDENKFFRGATLRICGDLAIEEAMCACSRYICDFIPVDRMFLQVYEVDLGAMRTLATATVDMGEEVNLLTPLAGELRDQIRRAVKSGVMGDVVVIESGDKNPIAREMLRFHGIPGWSILRMRLATEDGRIGAAVLTADGADRYTLDHARLFQLLEEPFTIALANVLVHREVVRLRDRLADDNRYLQRELLRGSGDEIVGVDFGLREVMHRVGHVAPTESPVLLTGETGVGKDVIASAIHRGSPRRDGPFIPVNCGAIPDSLLDSELFGHEKGAFTGALSRKRGRFERANGGTVLLDEIGEMPLQAQVRLLRVLQHREIERVGGAERIRVDIRVIAATNKDLAARVREGLFREDLWFRLNVFPIEVPPLRDRQSDIPALVQHFIERKAGELKIGETPKLAPGAIDDLIAYDWPGNVRELENRVEQAMILRHSGESLRFEDLGAALPQTTAPAAVDGESLKLDYVIAHHIRRVLDMTDWKIHGPGGAGELLGVNPNTLRHRMRKLAIPFRKQLQ